MRLFVADRSESGEPYQGILSAERINVGLYVLEAGATDTQIPHTENET
mgnify:CR=1 FL=1